MKPIEELRAKAITEVGLLGTELKRFETGIYKFSEPVVKLSDAEEIIKKQGEWISVEDELPTFSTGEKLNKVLVWYKDYIVFGYCFAKDRWKIPGFYSNFVDKIKLWRPLPEPPKQITGE